MFELSAIRDIVAITGVFIGLTYYVMNIRETRRNRRITLTTTLMQQFMTDEGYQKIMDLFVMQWDDLEDYLDKYDSRVNPENAARRMSLWNTLDTIGMLYRKGQLDMDTILASSQGIIHTLWLKFEPIVEYYRGTDYGENSYYNWEYLALELSKTLNVSTKTRYDTVGPPKE